MRLDEGRGWPSSGVSRTEAKPRAEGPSWTSMGPALTVVLPIEPKTPAARGEATISVFALRLKISSPVGPALTEAGGSDESFASCTRRVSATSRAMPARLATHDDTDWPDCAESFRWAALTG